MGITNVLMPLFRFIPEVKKPTAEPSLKNKIIWSLGILLIFFALGKITLMGLSEAAIEQLAGLQIILASDIGTLITLGIGPIVLSSIVLQLLIGGQIIKIDISTMEGRVAFQSLQKILTVVLCFFEGGIYIVSGMLKPMPGMFLPVLLQVAFGGIILMYMDEVVSKYGIGSGIGLFIAGNVAASFLWQLMMLPGISAIQPAGGIIPKFIASFGTGVNFIILLPLLLTIIIFLIVTYAHAMHVNIPITMGNRGLGGRYPVKFLYVSVMPVILATALFANVKIWAFAAKGIPIVNIILDGLAWATGTPFNLFTKIVLAISGEGFTGLMAMAPELLQGLVYLALMVIFCVVFGKLWIELGGQSSANIAQQLQNSGMYIPGFRRDKRIIENVLDRYIPQITVMGSIFVGLLAGMGNMLLGGLASGTGILLTVGIVYKLYEELAHQQILDNYPLLQKMLSKQ